MRPRGYPATAAVTVATAPEVPRGPAPAAGPFRCWFCGAPAAPLVKCACGAMVATSGRTLADPS